MPHPKDIVNRHGFRSGWLIDDNEQPWNEARHWKKTTDSFGRLTADGRRNVANIGSHYNFNPERQRFYINGTRFQLEYDTSSKFEDRVDDYVLKPAGGDVLEFTSAERFRYVVGFVLEASSAFGVNQELQGDDKLVVGYGEGDLANDMANANGWFWEFRGGSPADTVYLTTYRDGTLVDEKRVDNIPKAVTIWQRIEDRINWYNAGNREATQTYTVDGEQYNDIIGKTSVDDAKGPSRANFKYYFGIKADASTTGLELYVGSIGINILGRIDPIVRNKTALFEASHSGSDNWEPLFALKQDPDNPNVFINLIDLVISEISADADLELLAIGIDPSKTDASNFFKPIRHSDINSAVLHTTNITTFPDSDGNVVTSATNMGGYQLGHVAYYTVDTGSKRRDLNLSGVRKRGINDGDIVVILGKTDTAMDIICTYVTEQEY